MAPPRSSLWRGAASVLCFSALLTTSAAAQEAPSTAQAPSTAPAQGAPSTAVEPTDSTPVTDDAADADDDLDHATDAEAQPTATVETAPIDLAPVDTDGSSDEPARTEPPSEGSLLSSEPALAPAPPAAEELGAPEPELATTRRAIRRLRLEMETAYDQTGSHLEIAGGVLLGVGLVGAGVAFAPISTGYSVLNPDAVIITVETLSFTLLGVALALTIVGIVLDDQEGARWEPHRQRIRHLEEVASSIGRRAAVSREAVGVRF